MLNLRRALLAGVVDPLIWRRRRMPIAEHLARFRRQQWDDPETLRRRQERLLGDLLGHAVARVPYYRERASVTPATIAADPFGCLARFPFLTREDIRDNLDGLVVEMGRGTRRDHTSGSTGMPMDFVRDTVSVSASLATTIMSFEWAGIERGDRRIRFWGSHLGEAHDSAAKRLVDRFHDRTVIDAYGADDEAMRGYIALLNERPPISLEGYTEALQRIAEYGERHGLSVPSPRAVIAGGSAVYDNIRELLERFYGAPVFNQYGSRELGYISAECESHLGMHVFGETTILEIVGRDGLPVPDGEVGDIVATHLWNFTMPFIRYHTGDRGAMATEPCDCGRVYPLLESVVGRTGSCFVRADGNMVIPEVFIQLLAWEFDSPDVRRFQMVQESLDRVTVRVVPQPGTQGYSDEARRGIGARVSEILGAPCEVAFKLESEIEDSPSGKYFYTVSRVAATGS